MNGSLLPGVGHKILSSTFFSKRICPIWFVQYNGAIYLNNCVILGRLLSNRMDAYLAVQGFSLPQLFSAQTSCLKYISKS